MSHKYVNGFVFLSLQFVFWSSMALSFCSNWGTSTGTSTTAATGTLQQQYFHPAETTFSFSQAQPELASHFFGLDYNLSLQDTCIDSLFDTTTTTNGNNDSYSTFFSENYYAAAAADYFFPSFSIPPENDFLSRQSEAFFAPVDDHHREFEPFGYLPKRQKSYQNGYQVDISASSPLIFNGHVSNPSLVVPELLHANSTELLAPVLQEASVPEMQAHGYGGGTSTTKKAASGVLSAQSIAARERRRKITEKTQELGKLIPGGNKLNTAEMFQSASKYVKFLQAQVSLLQLMGFIQVTLVLHFC